MKEEYNENRRYKKIDFSFLVVIFVFSVITFVSSNNFFNTQIVDGEHESTSDETVDTQNISSELVFDRGGGAL